MACRPSLIPLRHILSLSPRATSCLLALLFKSLSPCFFAGEGSRILHIFGFGPSPHCCCEIGFSALLIWSFIAYMRTSIHTSILPHIALWGVRCRDLMRRLSFHCSYIQMSLCCDLPTKNIHIFVDQILSPYQCPAYQPFSSTSRDYVPAQQIQN